MKKRSLPEAYWDGYRVRLPHGRGASNWSYRAADKVIVGMWTDHLNFRSRVYDQVIPASHTNLPANRARSADLQHAIDHFGGLVNVVLMWRKSPDDHEVDDAQPRPWIMRITDFDPETGNLRCVQDQP